MKDQGRKPVASGRGCRGWRLMRWMGAGSLAVVVLYALLWGWSFRWKIDPNALWWEVGPVSLASLADAEAQAWALYEQMGLTQAMDEPVADLLGEHGNGRFWPGDPGWEPIVELLAAHQETLERIREAAQRPELGLVPSVYWEHLLAEERSKGTVDIEGWWADDGPVFTTERWLLQRRLMRLVQADLAEALHLGQIERAARNFQAMHGFWRQLRQAPDVAWRGLGLGQQMAVCELIARALVIDAQHPERRLSEADWQWVLMELRREPEPVLTWNDTQRQRVFRRLDLIYCPEGRIALDGLLVADLGVAIAQGLVFESARGWRWAERAASLGVPVAELGLISRQRAQEHLQQAMDAYAEDLQRSLVALHEYRQRHGGWPWEDRADSSWRHWPVRAAAEVMRQELPLYRVYLGAYRQAVEAALALEIVRARRGDYPLSLAELVPEFFSEEPMDRSTGEPLLYRRVAGRPWLYGRGLDGQDDGGALTEPWGPTFMPVRGDWVLHPPERE